MNDVGGDTTILNETQTTMGQWADETFGRCALESLLDRAQEEIEEAREAIRGDFDDEEICEEIADVIIILMRIPYYKGIDIQEEINRKMAINRNRKWKLRGDGHGDHI